MERCDTQGYADQATSPAIQAQGHTRPIRATGKAHKVIAAYYIGGPLDMTKQMLRASEPPRYLYAYEPISMPARFDADSMADHIVSTKQLAYRLLTQCRATHQPTFIYELENAGE